MLQEQWQRVNEIYYEALDRSAEERDSFIEDACEGDEELHNTIKALLQSNDEASGFLDRPALDVAAAIAIEFEPESLVGQQIGHYRTTRFLGAGGMGAVYEAQDTRLERRIALKILSAGAGADHTQRLCREAKAAAAVNHPNFVAIYDIGEDQNLSFIAMEYVEGKTLANHLTEGPLPLAEIIDIGIQVADALEVAHARGIMHRDIKPANLMLTPRGQVKVLDFGLAKITTPRVLLDGATLATNSATVTSIIMGTPQYASPEQLARKTVDGRSDVFSLGVVLYEMATALKHFGTAQLKAPNELDGIIQKCLQRDPALRCTAHELLVDLKDLRHRLIQSRAQKVTKESDDASFAGQSNHANGKAPSGIPTQTVGLVFQGLVLVLLIMIAFSVFGGERRILRGETDDFDRLLNAYDLRHDVLSRNCYLQALLIAVGITSLVLLRNEKLNVPGLDRSLSADSMHFVIAPVLLYLWIEFGFALDDLIKYRAEAWKFLSSIGDPHSHELSRRAMLFNDSGFMDGWFMCFRPGEHAINPTYIMGTAVAFTLVFGTLFSLNHACIVVGLRAAAQSVVSESERARNWVTRLVGASPWLAIVLLLACHLYFRIAGNQPNWIQPVICGGAILFTWWLSRRRL